MGQRRPVWLRPKVDEEVRVDLEAAIHVVHVNLKQVAALISHVGVELLVPGAEKGVGHIQPLAIQSAQQPPIQTSSSHAAISSS